MILGFFIGIAIGIFYVILYLLYLIQMNIRSAEKQLKNICNRLDSCGRTDEKH